MSCVFHWFCNECRLANVEWSITCMTHVVHMCIYITTPWIKKCGFLRRPDPTSHNGDEHNKLASLLLEDGIDAQLVK